MIEWASTYWYLCAIAFAIGVLTAAWIWLTGRVDADIGRDDIDERPAARLEPARPVIDVAEPVTFTAPAPEPAPVAAAPVAAAAPLMAAAAPSGGGDRPSIAAAVGAPDDLTLIKGVGPKLNSLLNSLGVTRFDQIAAWSAGDIGEVDRFLGNFRGRIDRDSWVEQAGLLARGDTAGFAAKFGELGSENR